MVRISDARMSGTGVRDDRAHVAPEAASADAGDRAGWG
jgi:dihydroxyacid dehydratase/phosphogluconate dehydratase